MAVARMLCTPDDLHFFVCLFVLLTDLSQLILKPLIRFVLQDF